MILRCISDVHLGQGIGDGAEDFRIDDKKFAEFMATATKDIKIYIIGDLFDIWESTEWNNRVETVEKIVNAHPLAFYTIAKGIGEGKIVYIPGNHDMDVKQGIFRSIANSTGLFIKCTEDEYVEEFDSELKVLLTHGHQWDDANCKYSVVGRAIAFVVGWLQRLGWKDAPVWLAEHIEAKIPGRTLGNEAYIDKAIARAKKLGCRAVVMGHTHKEDILRKDNMLYVNTGCVCGKDKLRETIVDVGYIITSARTRDVLFK